MTDRSLQRRRRHVAAGRFAERMAVWLLRVKGYRILERDHRTPVGEIDILAAKGEDLIAVEVKQRPTAAAAREALQPRQRRRIVRALEAYLARHAQYAERSIRFDVILVIGHFRIQHIVDAWRPER